MNQEAWDSLCEDMTPRKPPVDAQGFWSPEGGLDWTWPVLLRRLRLMRGLNQRQLAEEAGIVQSHVAKAESGSDVRLSTIVRLIKALGCRLSLRVQPIKPFELR
jgi:DNA-binding Xre family transcriptional regulator